MNATFLRSNILSVIILSLVLTGCATYSPAVQAAPQILNGDVQAIGPGAAKYVVEQALASAPGTSIWYEGTKYLFSAPIANNIGFVAMDTAGDKPVVICGGNISSCATFTSLVSFLVKQGWQQLATLPQYVVTVVEEIPSAAFTLIIIPANLNYSPIATGIVQ